MALTFTENLYYCLVPSQVNVFPKYVSEQVFAPLHEKITVPLPFVISQSVNASVSEEPKAYHASFSFDALKPTRQPAPMTNKAQAKNTIFFFIKIRCFGLSGKV